ncbi:MAG: hypothetical protein Q9162_003629 [Coniocarpon cinnabarinum]
MALMFRRSFHATASRQGQNPFFHLQALSNARETTRASQLSKLPRSAHSTQLELLKSEASVAPLSSDPGKQTTKDLKTAVNIARAASPKPQPSPQSWEREQRSLTSKPELQRNDRWREQYIASLAQRSKPDVAAGLQKLREDMAEGQKRIDAQLTAIRARSKSGAHLPYLFLVPLICVLTTQLYSQNEASKQAAKDAKEIETRLVKAEARAKRAEEYASRMRMKYRLASKRLQARPQSNVDKHPHTSTFHNPTGKTSQSAQDASERRVSSWFW